MCYWPIKFKGEFLRWLLSYLNVQFKEHNPANSVQWGIIKSKLSSKNPLISLPYLYDHTIDKVTCQSEAISFAIALRYGGKQLLGRDGIEIIFHRSVQESLKTIREFAFKCMDYTVAELQESFSDQVSFRVAPKLRYMDQMIRKDFKFMFGEVTLVDFEIAHVVLLLDFIAENTGVRNPFSDFYRLYNIAENVLALPGVKQYF